MSCFLGGGHKKIFVLVDALIRDFKAKKAYAQKTTKHTHLLRGKLLFALYYGSLTLFATILQKPFYLNNKCPLSHLYGINHIYPVWVQDILWFQHQIDNSQCSLRDPV